MGSWGPQPWLFVPAGPLGQHASAGPQELHSGCWSPHPGCACAKQPVGDSSTAVHHCCGWIGWLLATCDGAGDPSRMDHSILEEPALLGQFSSPFCGSFFHVRLGRYQLLSVAATPGRPSCFPFCVFRVFPLASPPLRWPLVATHILLQAGCYPTSVVLEWQPGSC